MIKSPFDRSKIPHKPGVYQFKNRAGKIIYVGKAVDLYSRVSSYFSSFQNSLKTAVLVSEIGSVETIVVESEIEALILEANLIKKHLPLYNVRLTDDKDYLYIKITKESYPKIVTARKQDLSGAKVYFGPFPSATTVKTTLKRLRRVFPWCQYPPKAEVQGSKFKVQNLRGCFYYHLKLCPGPCVGAVSKDQYNLIIKHFVQFMKGERQKLAKKLHKEMGSAARTLEFEKAQQLKRILDGIVYILQPNRIESYLENPNFLEDQNKLALETLRRDLSLATLPQRIECFDISNILGTNATGSMVVLTSGEIDKSQYRRFKISPPAGGSGKPNDYAMMAEMIGRRMKHLEWPNADLMLIDGGIGQVRAAKLQISNHKLQIPVFGLAKRMEWLYKPDGSIIKLPKSSLGLRLLQKVRDEAHRFAITYHRKLRSKQFLRDTIS